MVFLATFRSAFHLFLLGFVLSFWSGNAYVVRLPQLKQRQQTINRIKQTQQCRISKFTESFWCLYAAEPTSAETSTATTTTATADPDLELLPSVREAIQEESAEKDQALDDWETAIGLISSKTGLSSDEAELALAKAHGWRAWVKVTSKFAKKYMKTSLPQASQLEEVLDWSMNSPLNLSQEQLGIAITTTPEVYLMDPKNNLENVLNVAPAEYQNEDKLIALVKDDPSTLSLTVNCVDTGCSSSCGTCWVSYENRKKSS